MEEVGEKLSDLNKQYLDAMMMGNKELAASLKEQLDANLDKKRVFSRTSVIQANTILNDDNAKVKDINDYLDKTFGEVWVEWEIETLERMLWLRSGTTLSDINADKIQALKSLFNSEEAWLDWYIFNQVAVALGGAIADFTIVKAPSNGMAVAAMKLMSELRPEVPFSLEVKKYVCLLLIHEGVYTPPPSIKLIIEEEFARLVSPESREKWMDVLKKMFMILRGNTNTNEEASDIQARRLTVLEMASERY